MKTINHHKKNIGQIKSGFTLVEVLITITVIGIGLLAVFLTFVLAVQITSRSKHMTIAYQKMNQVMEEVRATPYNSLSVGTTTQSVSELPSGSLTKTIAIYESDTFIKSVSLQITWNERGNPMSVNETSLATIGGVNE